MMKFLSRLGGESREMISAKKTITLTFFELEHHRHRIAEEAATIFIENLFLSRSSLKLTATKPIEVADRAETKK
jgi:hypothetical protein